MKSKNTTYYLLAFLLFIWGYVSFMVFKNFNKKTDFSSQIIQTNFNEQLKVNHFEYELLLNYNTPFKLVNTVVPKSTPININTQVNYTPKPPQPKSIFSGKPTENKPPININNSDDILKKIQYYGLIQNNSNQGKIAVLLYDKEEYLVEKGTKTKDFVVENIFETHVQILINESSYAIKIASQ